MLSYLSRLFRPKSKDSAISSDEYQSRVAREIEIFANNKKVHDLPDIYHYWSNKYLAPNYMHIFDIQNPNHFFYKYIQEHFSAFQGNSFSILSIGSGNCDMECHLAKKLIDNNILNFSIECMDINPHMLERGTELAKEMNIESHIDTLCADFNLWRPAKSYDIILANQCLHHVQELEHLYVSISDALKQGGKLLVSDMIGRNGHQRWPEALEIVREFWKELPQEYKYNRLMNRQEDEYINHDCSVGNFEGIRAQDVLPLLIQYFNFELFIPFGNVIFTFVDRPFGHNFNADADWDRSFIDRVHQKDEEAMLAGTIPPTQMLASLTKEQTSGIKLVHDKLTPEFCVRTK